MSYTVMNVLQDGRLFDISQLIQTIRWGGDIRQAARKLSLDMVYSKDPYIPQYKPPLGSILTLTNQEEIIRTVTFTPEINTDGKLVVTSYDHLFYLLKSTGTYIFRNLTADAIIKRVCGDLRIPVGDIPATGVTLDKLILRDKTFFDMCVIALTETSKRNGKKYQIKMKQGKLTVIEKGAQTVRWLITEGQNLISASYKESIEDMRNKIIIVGDKDQVLAEIKDENLFKQYGVLQELKREGNIKAAEAQVIAQNIFKDLAKVSKEASVECLGLDGVEAGTAIEVKESLTGLTGTFYVDTDDHTIENGQHTMSLKLNWTDEVATKEADKDGGK